MFSKINKVVLNITQFCNLDCQYCHLPTEFKNNKECFKDWENLREFIKKLPIGEQLEIRFLGGEVTAFPEEMRKAVAEIKKIEQDIDVRIIFSYPTNGTNYKAVIDMADIIPLRHVSFSWDGLGNAESRCGNFDNEYYKDAIRAFGGTDINISFCVTPQTVETMYESLCFAIDNGIKSFSFYFTYEGDYSNKEFLSKFEKQLQLINEKFVNDYNNGNKWQYHNWEVLKSRMSATHDTSKCKNLGRILGVGIDGRVSPCIIMGDHGAYILGNIKEGLSEQQVKRFVNDFLQPAPCSCANKQCFECPSSCYVQNGHLMNRYQNSCQVRTIERLDFEKNFHKLNITPMDEKNYWYNDMNIDKKLSDNYSLPFGNPKINQENITKTEKMEVFKNWNGKGT